MKRLISTFCLSLLAAAALAQGTVAFINPSSTLVSAGPMAGPYLPTTGAVGSWYFGLYTAASTVRSVYLLDLLTPTWTFTGNYATNLSTPGRFNGGVSVATLTGWPTGVTNSFCIVGWSADLGHDFPTAYDTIYNLAYNGAGTMGVSQVGFGAAGGGTEGLPTFNLFGPVPTGQGTPLSIGWTLALPIPEPGAFALAGLGAAAVLTFRRRG